MKYQIYNVHLINGEVLTITEPTSSPGNKTLYYKMNTCDDSNVIKITDPFRGRISIPKKCILYMVAEKQIEEFDVDLEPVAPEEIRERRYQCNPNESL